MNGLLYLEYLEIKKKWHIYFISLILLCFGVYFEFWFAYIFIFALLGTRNMLTAFERENKINRHILTTGASRKDLVYTKFFVSTLKILFCFALLLVITLIFNYNFLLTLLFYFLSALIINPIIQSMFFKFREESDVPAMWIVIVFLVLFCMLPLKYIFGVDGIYKSINVTTISYTIIFFASIFWNIYICKLTAKKIENRDFK